MTLRPANCFLFLCLGAAQVLNAQLKRGPVGPDGVHAAIPKPSNLRVISPDIAVPDLIDKMVGISQGLGVQCTYCHAPRPGIDPDYDLDFPSDANPNKAKARIMLRMTEDINRKYLAELSGPHRGGPITCGNCHQGQTVPAAYKPQPGFVVK